MADRKQYSGILDQPISPPSIFDEDFNERFSTDVDERWEALFQHFGIDRAASNSWALIAAELAKTHVSGFSVERQQPKPKSPNPTERRGRPPEQDMRILPVAAFTVLYRRKHNCTESRVSEVIGKGGYSLLPVSERSVRKIFQTPEFKAFANFFENVANSLGDKRALDDLFEDDAVLGTAAPWAEWKKVLGT
jgi:hypothetical protein